MPGVDFFYSQNINLGCEIERTRSFRRHSPLRAVNVIFDRALVSIRFEGETLEVVTKLVVYESSIRRKHSQYIGIE